MKINPDKIDTRGLFMKGFSCQRAIAYLNPDDSGKELSILFEDNTIYNTKINHDNLSNLLTVIEELNGGITVIGFNSSDIYRSLLEAGAEELPILHDVVLADKLQKCTKISKSIKRLLFDYLNVLLEEDSEDNNDLTLALTYGFNLYGHLRAGLMSLGMYDLYTKIEVPYQRINFLMENNGLSFDSDKAESIKEDINLRIDEAQRLISKLENKSTEHQISPVINNITQENNEIKLLGDKIKKLKRIRDTYLDNYRSYINVSDNKIHPTLNQIGTLTGRVTTCRPNLQSIPRSFDGIDVRSCFIVSKPSNILVRIDFKQIELMVFAALSGSDKLIEGFIESQDFHSYTASILFDKKVTDISSNERNIAKQVTFSIIYGAGAASIAEKAKISFEEASTFLSIFNSNFPEINQFKARLVKYSRAKGSAYTIAKRFRPISEFLSTDHQSIRKAERIATNHPIQGSVADIMKASIVSVYEEIKHNPEIKLLLQIHDELILEMPDDIAQEILPKLKDIMQTNHPEWFKKRINLRVKISVGKTLSTNIGDKTNEYTL